MRIACWTPGGAPNHNQTLMKGIGERILAIRVGLGLNQAKFAGLVGVSQPTVARWENEEDMPGEQNLGKIARLGGISASQLRYGTALSHGNPRTPVVGYVGAGEAVIPIDDHEKGQGLEMVKTPPGIEGTDIVALRVRGNSMRPALRDGWLIFYRKEQDGVPEDCLNQVCVVALADGRLMVKELRRGSSRGLYDLHAWNATSEPLEDQKVDWAAKVLSFTAP